MTTLTCAYGRQRIEFSVEFRKVRTLSITVLPNGKVRVVAPVGAAEDRILTRVRKRGRWIVRQWERQVLLLPEPPLVKELYSGQSVRYLGRQYRLRIYVEQERGAAEVKFSRSAMEVRSGKVMTGYEAAMLVDSWLCRRSAEVIAERFNRCRRLVESHGITGGGVTLRAMTRRWGSCSRAGRILLNPDLIRAPVSCIDYVILHELCHLKEHSHGPAFYRLLTKVLPDWKLRRDRLARIH